MKQSSRFDDSDFQALNRKITLKEKDRYDVLEQIHKKIDVAPTTRKSAPPSKYYFAMVAAAVVFMLVLVPLIFQKDGLQEGRVPAEETPSEDIYMEELEEIFAANNVKGVFHIEEVEHGVIVFFVEQIRKADVKFKDLNAMFIKRTENGWEESLEGGSHQIFQDQTELSHQLLMKASDESPFPIIFGAIINPEITEVLVVDPEKSKEFKAEIIKSDSGARYWFTFVDFQPDELFEIHGLTSDGKAVYSMDTLYRESAELRQVDPNAENFELTAVEREAYELLKGDLDVRHVKDLSPVSIAKIYVQAYLDGEIEVKYELYTDRDDVQQIRKEEYFSQMGGATQEQIKEAYFGIQNGTFDDRGDHGYISYKTMYGQLMGFSMVKEVDGSWSVSFMPTQ